MFFLDSQMWFSFPRMWGNSGHCSLFLFFMWCHNLFSKLAKSMCIYLMIILNYTMNQLSHIAAFLFCL